jgi:hypothetical protein
MKRSQVIALAALAVAENMGLKVGYASEIKSQADYESQLKTLIRSLWFGRIDLFGYVDSHVSMVTRFFGQAWRQGSKDCGVNFPSESSVEELQRFDEETNDEIRRVLPFAEEIVAAKDADGNVDQFIIRARMWANQWGRIRNLASQIVCKDRKLRWRRNPLKESCVDCVRMDGRVYRASTWQKYGILPRTRELACHGYYCGCGFEPTDEPITPGRPPALVGG